MNLVSIGTTPPIKLQLIARVQNEGVALRYALPQQDGISSVRIDAEFTAFAFTQNHKVWAQSSSGAHPHENEHLPTTLTAAPATLENPVTIEHTSGYYMALTETAVENYAATRFVRSSSAPPTLRYDLRGAVNGTLPFTSPWRVLMIAPTAARLVEQNYLMYNLAPPRASPTRHGSSRARRCVSVMSKVLPMPNQWSTLSRTAALNTSSLTRVGMARNTIRHTALSRP